jgi:predicted permease
MLHDLRFALRQLAKSPGYTIVVVLTLALGIAVNTNIFGIVGAFFMRPMPVPDADRLALILQRSDAWSLPHGISFPDFRDYRARTTTFSDLIAFFPQPAHFSAEGKTPERAWIEIVTPNGFSALGVPAALGRTLVPSDGEAQGAQPVAVLSHRCWQNRFGGDPRVVGQVIQINGHAFTVVGVAREGFDGFTSSLAMNAFVPSGAITEVYGDGAKFLDERGIPNWRALGKLKPGATVAAADAEVKVVTAQLVRDYPDSHKGTQGMVLSEIRCRPDPTVADFTVVFAFLFTGLVTLVMLIACANVTNLMLARALTRQKELTLRAALGASRWRLVRQLLVESLVLAGLAGVVGWFLAERAGQLFARFAPQGDIPVVTQTGPAPRDYLFTVALSLLVGIASGLIPAWRASRVDLVESLKESPGGRLADGRHRLRNILVVSQVAFSLVVLIGAGLFVQSLQRARTVNLGFRRDHILMASFDLGLQGYSFERGQTFIRQLLDKTRALPGVEAAGLTQHVPFDYYVQIRDIWPETPPAQFKDGSTSIAYSRVDPGIFDLMGLRLLQGRLLAETDTESAPRVVVINQAMATQCWPGEDAVGRRLRLSRDGPWVEVVGVLATAKYVMLAEQARPYFYLPLKQDYYSPLTLMVRSRGEPLALTNDLRSAVQSIDPHLPVYSVRTMEDLMDTSIFALLPMRMGAALAATQGTIGLLLAIMGLYAVVSYGVTRRTREIGIRVALGANPRTVLGFVVNEGMRLTAIGLGLGFILAVALGLVMSKLLFGLGAIDPLVIVGVTLLLALTSGLACWIPARRATRVDPVIALRSE